MVSPSLDRRILGKNTEAKRMDLLLGVVDSTVFLAPAAIISSSSSLFAANEISRRDIPLIRVSLTFRLLLTNLLNNELVKTRFLGSAFQHPLLDTILRKEPENAYLFHLSDTMRTVHDF